MKEITLERVETQPQIDTLCAIASGCGTRPLTPFCLPASRIT